MSRLHTAYQRTLKQELCFVGIGLHSGKKTTLRLHPSNDPNGIYFLRTDVKSGTGLIAARWYNVTDTTLSTTIGNDKHITVSTIEHLMAALYGCGIDNALIEIDGPEVPIMDGSAEPFSSTIEHYGSQTIPYARKAIWIKEPIAVRDGEKYALLLPSSTQRITISIDFPSAAIGSQTYSVELVNEAFLHDIARARTFGFAHEIKELQEQGLARGGSLNNAILVDGERIINSEGLRFNNEFVRHKVLDAFGDLSLAGVPIFGHYYAYKAGHTLNQKLISKLFSSYSSWNYIAVGEFNRMMGGVNDKSGLDESISADMLTTAKINNANR